MNSISESPISFHDSLASQIDTAVSSRPQSKVKSVPTSHHAPVGDSSNITFKKIEDSATPELTHVTVPDLQDVSSTSVSESKITGKDLRDCIEAVTSQLTPFFIPCDEKNASQIPVLDKKGERIEFHENTISAETGDLALEASHEVAKERFVAHLMLLYGKPVIDCFYPEEKRKEPLTLLQIHLLREQLNKFQQDVEAACARDPSKYMACLKAQLESLQKLNSTVTTVLESDSTLKAQVDTITTSLSKQLGVTPETIQTGVVAGLAISAVAAAAATGVGLPAALHVAATSAMAAFSHGAGVSTLPMMGASLKGAAATSGLAAASVSHGSVAAAANPYLGLAIVTATLLGGTGLGALGGLAVGSTIVGLDWSRGGNMEVTGPEMSGCVIGGAGVGFWMAFGGSLFGPAGLNIGVAHPATWGLYGAEIGGALGSTIVGGMFGIDRLNTMGAFENYPALQTAFSSNGEEGPHELLHRYLPWSADLSPGAQIALAAALGGIFGAAVMGAESYLAGGLAQWAAYYPAHLAAAVAGGN